MVITGCSTRLRSTGRGLAAALRPFGESRMLPRAAYVDPAVFEWEQRNFFGGGWVCVARSEQLPQPGDQRAEATGTGGVLLVRDEDGALHAFANTCRHRGHELLPCGSGTQARMIICPYHAWTYTLAGELRAAGSFKKVPGFEFVFVGTVGAAGDRVARPGVRRHVGRCFFASWVRRWPSWTRSWRRTSRSGW